ADERRATSGPAALLVRGQGHGVFVLELVHRVASPGATRDGRGALPNGCGLGCRFAGSSRRTPRRPPRAARVAGGGAARRRPTSRPSVRAAQNSIASPTNQVPSPSRGVRPTPKLSIALYWYSPNT